jgi:hypothetical protein
MTNHVCLICKKKQVWQQVRCRNAQRCSGMKKRLGKFRSLVLYPAELPVRSVNFNGLEQFGPCLRRLPGSLARGTAPPSQIGHAP